MKDIQKKWFVQERLADDLIDHLLKLRGFEDREAFLHPEFPAGLHDPYLMKGMKIAVDRLVKAIEAHEPIGVFADYDTDGTPGAALFVDGLRALDNQPLVYVPTRTEGYGLTVHGLEALAAAGAKVVVTIDLGITGKAEAQKAQELGLDLIVTDHHVVQDDLYPAAAYSVINPKQTDCAYPFKELCGGGIIWKVWGAILDVLAVRQSPILQGRNPGGLWRWALDLAAISTICDMVPLVDENRVIASFGLQVLRKTRRPGLLALLAVADVDPIKASATTVGFQIGPRINAPTRLAKESISGDDIPGPQCSIALALLLSRSKQEATRLAGDLHLMNQERQVQLEEVLAEATARVEAEGLDQRKVIVLSGQGWPAGIVGLVAGRIMERFGRPTFVLGTDGITATGSARSIDGFHLVEAVRSSKANIQRFGGHARAAGITLEEQYLATLYEDLLAFADQTLTDDQLGPKLDLAAQLEPTDLTLEVAEDIERCAPFGLGNPRPTFLLPKARVIDQRLVGASKKHVKCTLRLEGSDQIISAIGFNLADKLETIGIDQVVDLAVAMNVNEWQGRRELDLQIVDVRASQKGM